MVCYGSSANNFPCNSQTWVQVGTAIVGAIIALIATFMFRLKLLKYEMGTDVMNNLQKKIQDGAKAFLKTEYYYLTFFVIFIFAILVIVFSVSTGSSINATAGIRIGACFVAGAILSASAGYYGMIVATDANVRTTQAADKQGLDAALQVAFTGGAAMGFVVVGLGLIGLAGFYLIMGVGYKENNSDCLSIYAYPCAFVNRQMAMKSLAGFGFGASSIALFARVAGGIYTKAADVGADLVGKVEAGIPEDDPRNPAVIADNVGDNVGDVAGMGADLFESYVGSIIAAATLANGDAAKIALPFWIAGGGVVASLIGYFFVSTVENASQKQLMWALHKGTIVASTLVLGISALFIFFLFGMNDGQCELTIAGDQCSTRVTEGYRIYACIVIGLFAGILIGQSTEYFTSYEYPSVRSITAAGITGPATVIIQGLGIGMISCVPPVFVLVATILGCNALASQYGIAIAAVGMLSTLGITLAQDAYGPVADNAGGIAEMAELDERVRGVTDNLDALGNTTAATGKGFAIGSAVLTSLALLSAFTIEAGVSASNISDPVVLAGALLGAMLPFLFAALTMLSVQKAAGAIIVEVRRQFKEIPGLMEGTAEADSDTCIAISTQSSLEEMVLPALWAILAPLCVGFLIGPRCLTGLLGGSIAAGMMLAIMMSNAGGAWDNSKKYIEIEGACGGKGTPTHHACVVGDTVGDPFKDTSGPALNILIKLMSMVSLVISSLIAGNNDYESFYWGFIPIALLIVGTIWAYMKFWSDPIDITQDVGGAAKDEDVKVDVEPAV
ncbi:hypothetical protein TrVE_jg7390 [Triparma verrucosa]|uniref:H(+)-exporting diphosphatase n=1 Tax=Triparma verrucosa TaxID=1606542 RepID=A0A9W7CH50_9STRA|nr:hypothetical protein TrVE_jg7390 [Triparma verrucosa]